MPFTWVGIRANWRTVEGARSQGLRSQGARCDIDGQVHLVQF